MDVMAFYIIAGIIIVTALLVVASRNPVVSAIWLVACLFAQAALFVLLNAHLVAALQVLLYAGAIMVLILFTIMLLNLAPSALKWKTIAGERLVLGSGVLYLAGAIGFSVWLMKKSYEAPVLKGIVIGSIENVGELLLTKYFIPFELISVTLLAAIVGAIVMSKKI